MLFHPWAQACKKVEVQEALPPAGVLGAEPLSLVPQRFFREPAKRCSRALAASHGFFDRLRHILRGMPFFFFEKFLKNVSETDMKTSRF